MGIISEIFKRKTNEDDIIISKKEMYEIKLRQLNQNNSKVRIIVGDNSCDEKNINGIDVPDGAFINDKGEIEYKTVEIEIRPENIICPDCGGITKEGLEYCDQCGGELF